MIFDNAIYIKDPHLSLGFANRIRKDYEKNIYDKFKYIRKWCIENKVSIVRFTGDIFDSSSEDNWSFKKYRLNKRLLQYLIDENGTSDFKISLESNKGNHDMFHGNSELEETVFDEMVSENIIKNITKDPKTGHTNLPKVPSCFRVQGIDYGTHDKVLSDIQLLNDEKYDASFKVAILHSNIAPSKEADDKIVDFSYNYLIDKFPDIDVFVCGHYHIGFDTTTLMRENGKECTFINNWNLTRVVRDYETQLDEHEPEFEHMKIYINDDTFSCICKTHKIPFVTYNDTFNYKHIMFNNKSSKELFNFFNKDSITELLNQESNDIDLINDIAKKKSYNNESIQKAVEYLNNAK